MQLFPWMRSDGQEAPKVTTRILCSSGLWRVLLSIFWLLFVAVLLVEGGGRGLFVEKWLVTYPVFFFGVNGSFATDVECDAEILGSFLAELGTTSTTLQCPINYPAAYVSRCICLLVDGVVW